MQNMLKKCSRCIKSLWDFDT